MNLCLVPFDFMTIREFRSVETAEPRSTVRVLFKSEEITTAYICHMQVAS
jgi:hypothetical protein